MWALVGLLAGALAGHALWGFWGATAVGLIGFLVGAAFSNRGQRARFRKPDFIAPPQDAATRREAELRERIASLEHRVALLEGGAVVPPVAASAATSSTTAYELQPYEHADPFVPVASAAANDASEPFEPVLPAAPIEPVVSAAPVAASTEPVAADGTPVRPPMPPPHPLWAWLTGGNALTRVGVVVLFFGVAFLLRYFAEYFTLTIEWKLGGVALVGAALLVAGLRLAPVRAGYGLSLQGAGAGILYLTTFAAFRLYPVLSPEVAIALLIAIAVVTIALALRSDSEPLAALALCGGFLAPLLGNTEGEPLPLFAYFAVLNGAIFVVAWRRTWRTLNVIGFVATFALGLFWGYRYYTDAHLWVVEPFLVLFFAFYVTIAIVEASRATPEVSRPIAGILVFGVPLAAFALQVALVHNIEHASAASALVLAGIYALLFLALRRRDGIGFALLAPAFLALAVIFATLAIPLAFDDRWTAALWAVEAAGVYWIGVRQRSVLARAFALLVEVGAGVAFAGTAAAVDASMPFANARFIGAMLIGLSGLATAFVADRASPLMSERERPIAAFVFVWGTLWWLGGGALEIHREFARASVPHGILAWVSASVALALALTRALQWPRLALAGAVMLPAIAYVALRDFNQARTTLTAYGWLVWPAAWVVQWAGLYILDGASASAAAAAPRPVTKAGALRIAHALSAFALTAQIAWEASEWVGRITPAHTAWVACVAALPAIAYLAAVARWRNVALWPMSAHGDAYALAAGTPIAALLALWFIAVNVLSPGDVAPLPYLPLANPLDVTLALALAALYAWGSRFAPLAASQRYGWLGFGLFVAMNGIVLRTAHHWAGIPWHLPALLASKPLQASLTLAWTLTAVAVMYASTRRRLRALWIVGAVLLVIVVVKLFAIDLSALSGLSRVVAFLGVGVLLLGIGYASPLPPSAQPER